MQLHLHSQLNTWLRLGKNNCKTRQETLKLLDLMHLILEILEYFKFSGSISKLWFNAIHICKSQGNVLYIIELHILNTHFKDQNRLKIKSENVDNKSSLLNTLKPRQYCCHFAADIFLCIFLCDNCQVTPLWGDFTFSVCFRCIRCCNNFRLSRQNHCAKS